MIADRIKKMTCITFNAVLNSVYFDKFAVSNRCLISVVCSGVAYILGSPWIDFLSPDLSRMCVGCLSASH